jgi:predicted porin
MKKSLLALAVLGAFAGAASAQSSVTLYGRVDLSLAKNIGSDAKGVQNGSGSRLGFRGVEDLGGGLKAIFNIEHRFNADTGALTNAAKFWQGRSIVGLEGGFGRVWLGREYSPGFLKGWLVSDPWGYDTVAQLSFNTGAIGNVRRDDTVNYQFEANGFGIWGQIAEAETNGRGPDRPMGLALWYGAGPLYISYSFENPTNADDVWHHLTVNYDFGMAKIVTGFGTGTSAVDNTHRNMNISLVAPVGGGEFRIGYGSLKNTSADVTVSSKIGVGYHYSLSKRTTVYADFARDSKALGPKTGYDFGIKHNF